MNIGLSFPVYITCEKHLLIFKDFIQSVESSKTKEANRKLMKIAVINVILPEYLQNALELLKSNNYTIINNPYGNSVSGAWNTGIKTCIDNGCEFVMVPNTDIIVHEDCIDNLIDFWYSTQNKYGLWCARPLANKHEMETVVIEDRTVEVGLYSFFGVSKRNIDILARLEKEGGELYPGYFDTNFSPAYFEDNDYDRRLYIAGMKPAATHLAVYLHIGSQTVKNDKDLEKKNVVTFEKNKKYFKHKWNMMVNGRPNPYEDGGNIGAFGKSGHLIGNYYNSIKKISDERKEELLKIANESDIINCVDIDISDIFVILFLSIMKNKKFIFNNNHKSCGVFMCAIKELNIEHEFI